jgi:hypothetical protein
MVYPYLLHRKPTHSIGGYTARGSSSEPQSSPQLSLAIRFHIACMYKLSIHQSGHSYLCALVYRYEQTGSSFVPPLSCRRKENLTWLAQDKQGRASNSPCDTESEFASSGGHRLRRESRDGEHVAE